MRNSHTVFAGFVTQRSELKTNTKRCAVWLQDSKARAMFDSIISAPAADPWMIFHEGFYYFCESRDQTTIYIRKSKHHLDIGRDAGTKIWSPPRKGPNSKNVWAPELHFINGKWFIYYAADDGKNENHRMWVLESKTSDPLGEYICRGCLEPKAGPLTARSLPTMTQMYFVWSGWPGKVDGQQNLYVAPMSNPYTDRAASGPDLGTHREPGNDTRCRSTKAPGSQARWHAFRRLFGQRQLDDALLPGMLELTGADFLDAPPGRESGPVFATRTKSFGASGIVRFVKSPCRDGRLDFYSTPRPIRKMAGSIAASTRNDLTGIPTAARTSVIRRSRNRQIVSPLKISRTQEKKGARGHRAGLQPPCSAPLVPFISDAAGAPESCALASHLL